MNAHSLNTARAAGFLAVTAALILASTAPADESKKARYPRSPSDANVQLVPKAWKAVAVKQLAPADLDRLLAASQKGDKVKLASAAPDDVFFRRVHLDLVGRLPTARETKAFLADSSPDRRSKVIDRLLASSDFARHRARYWRDVIVARATSNQGFVKRPREVSLETWLYEQFKDNSNWGTITRALITADGMIELREPTKGGDSAMLLCHERDDGPVERANDTARVFLGINLQCAQCHDHPDDIWKREQFHQMAAFYGKLGERVRLIREPTLNFETSLVVRRFGDYRMPDRDDPTKRTTVHPRFLTGEEPGRNLSDRARRKALAGYVTAKDNYYFAAAFVNRVWGELMGQAFVMPVDNLGPLQAPLYSDVLLGLAASFRASEFDIQALYRLIANSQAYQRQMRVGDNPAEHVRFAGTYPTRLRGEALWDSLSTALGSINGPMPNMGIGGAGPRRSFMPLRMAFAEMFRIDPSAKPEDIEGSVPQSLMLMNNQAINAQIKATGFTVLARVLREFRRDGDAIEQVYLRALGRNPSVREKTVCLEHIASVGERGPAFEDILWALINSAEFRTKR